MYWYLFLRRGKSESGDIDCLITHPSFTSDDKAKTKSHLLKNVVTCLEKCGLICDTISHGDVKFMVTLTLTSAKLNLYIKLFVWNDSHANYPSIIHRVHAN